MTHSTTEPFDFTADMAAIVEKQIKPVRKPPVSIYAERNIISSAANDKVTRPLCFQTGLALHPEIWE
jgi:hypothetical protein